jgi:hypothetical protein
MTLKRFLTAPNDASAYFIGGVKAKFISNKIKYSKKCTRQSSWRLDRERQKF